MRELARSRLTLSSVVVLAVTIAGGCGTSAGSLRADGSIDRVTPSALSPVSTTLETSERASGESRRGADGAYIPPVANPDGSIDLSKSAVPGQAEAVAAEIADLTARSGVEVGLECSRIPPDADFTSSSFRPAVAVIDGVCRVYGWMSAIGPPFTYKQNGELLTSILGWTEVPEIIVSSVREAVSNN
jgi:hypothetical protein